MGKTARTKFSEPYKNDQMIFDGANGFTRMKADNIGGHSEPR